MSAVGAIPPSSISPPVPATPLENIVRIQVTPPVFLSFEPSNPPRALQNRCCFYTLQECEVLARTCALSLVCGMIAAIVALGSVLVYHASKGESDVNPLIEYQYVIVGVTGGATIISYPLLKSYIERGQCCTN